MKRVQFNFTPEPPELMVSIKIASAYSGKKLRAFVSELLQLGLDVYNKREGKKNAAKS